MSDYSVLQSFGCHHLHRWHQHLHLYPLQELKLLFGYLVVRAIPLSISHVILRLSNISLAVGILLSFCHLSPHELVRVVADSTRVRVQHWLPVRVFRVHLSARERSHGNSDSSWLNCCPLNHRHPYPAPLDTRGLYGFQRQLVGGCNPRRLGNLCPEVQETNLRHINSENIIFSNLETEVIKLTSRITTVHAFPQRVKLLQ